MACEDGVFNTWPGFPERQAGGSSVNEHGITVSAPCEGIYYGVTIEKSESKSTRGPQGPYIVKKYQLNCAKQSIPKGSTRKDTIEDAMKEANAYIKKRVKKPEDKGGIHDKTGEYCASQVPAEPEPEEPVADKPEKEETFADKAFDMMKALFEQPLQNGQPPTEISVFGERGKPLPSAPALIGQPIAYNKHGDSIPVNGEPPVEPEDKSHEDEARLEQESRIKTVDSIDYKHSQAVAHITEEGKKAKKDLRAKYIAGPPYVSWIYEEQLMILFDEHKISEPVDCEYNAWSEWSSCEGRWNHRPHKTQERHRSVKTQAKYGGTPCSKSDFDTREEKPCPDVDCEYGAWSDWGTPALVNNPNGGEGQPEQIWAQIRTKSPISQASGDGEVCFPPPPHNNSKKEVRPVSPVDAKWNWSEWSECVEYSQYRTNPLIEEAKYGGQPYESQTETRPCEMPIDCVMSEWTDWTDCANGQQERTKTQLIDPQHGGIPCNEMTYESQVCEMPPEPIDCVMSGWTDWTPCNSPDGGSTGMQERTQTIVTAAQYGGIPCNEMTYESRVCDMPVAPVQDDEGTTQEDLLPPQAPPPPPEPEPAPAPIDCELSAWSAWTECDRWNTEGIQRRTRYVKTQAEFGGTECVGPLEETKPCTPIDCVMGDWEEWGECYQDADDTWTQRRDRRHRGPDYDWPYFLNGQGIWGGQSCMDFQDVDWRICPTPPVEEPEPEPASAPAADPTPTPAEEPAEEPAETPPPAADASTGGGGAPASTPAETTTESTEEPKVEKCKDRNRETNADGSCGSSCKDGHDWESAEADAKCVCVEGCWKKWAMYGGLLASLAGGGYYYFVKRKG